MSHSKVNLTPTTSFSVSLSHSSAGKKVHWDGEDHVIEELTDAR